MKKEKDMLCMMKELERFRLPGCIIEIMEELQREAFMDGYRYALALLEESMPGGKERAGDPR